MTELNWAELWRELSERFLRPETEGQGGRWQGDRASHFDAAVKRKRRERPDSLLDFVVGRLHPEDTVLDIGTGTGRFAIPMARVARSVTVVEPSPSMAAFLRENAAAEGLTNIHMLDVGWENVEVEPHDVAFCSHAMYTSLDLVGFVRKMERSARDSCFLVMRVPSHDGVMRELSQHIYGQPHDSPNFVVGYNVLYGMGIYANVLMENFVRTWTNDSLEDALERARRHLRLGDSTAHDDVIWETLAQRLTLRDGQYHWPDGMRSALVWWELRSLGQHQVIPWEGPRQKQEHGPFLYLPGEGGYGGDGEGGDDYDVYGMTVSNGNVPLGAQDREQVPLGLEEGLDTPGHLLDEVFPVGAECGESRGNEDTQGHECQAHQDQGQPMALKSLSQN